MAILVQIVNDLLVALRAAASKAAANPVARLRALVIAEVHIPLHAAARSLRRSVRAPQLATARPSSSHRAVRRGDKPLQTRAGSGHSCGRISKIARERNDERDTHLVLRRIDVVPRNRSAECGADRRALCRSCTSDGLRTVPTNLARMRCSETSRFTAREGKARSSTYPRRVQQKKSPS